MVCDLFTSATSAPVDSNVLPREPHERWAAALGDYRQGLGSEQCGGCRYYVVLGGASMSDWGICSNANSPHDGTAMFEHGGCIACDEALSGWGGVIPRRLLQRKVRDDQ